jgi:hypothetical protein
LGKKFLKGGTELKNYSQELKFFSLADTPLSIFLATPLDTVAGIFILGIGIIPGIIFLLFNSSLIESKYDQVLGLIEFFVHAVTSI